MKTYGVLGLSLVLGVFVSLCPTHLAADQDPPSVFQGDYQGIVTRVVDGDTFEARVFLWPDLESVVSIRIAGIEAPETNARYCAGEIWFGQLATAELQQELPVGQRIILSNVELGAFAGRVVADVERDNPQRDSSIADQMLRHEHAMIIPRPSGAARPDICQHILSQRRGQ